SYSFFFSPYFSFCTFLLPRSSTLFPYTTLFRSVAHLAGGVDAVLALAVDQDHLAAAVVGGDVHVLAQLDVALGAEDEGAAVAPGAQTLRSEPVHAHEARRPGGERDVRVAVVVELGMLGVAEVADRAGEDLAVLGAGEGEHLLEVVG